MHRVLIFLAILIAVPGLAAQSFQRQTERLGRALENMASLPSVAASTHLTAAKGKAAQAVGPASGPSEANLVLAEGALHVLFGDADEYVVFGRASIARRGETAWAPRRDRMFGGVPTPFVLDPELFFRALARLRPTVSHADVGEADGRPVELYSVELRPEDAGEMTWAGLLPPPVGLAFAFGMFAGAGAVELPKPKIRTDLAIAIDPATEQIIELRIQLIERSPFGAQGGQIAIRVGQGGVVQFGENESEDEDELLAEDVDYRDGLRVRELADLETLRVLTVTFREHGVAVLPELGADARVLLGMPPVSENVPAPETPVHDR